MLDFIRSQRLDPTKLRGQANDGAGNMSGVRRAAARISSRSIYSLCLPLSQPGCGVLI